MTFIITFNIFSLKSKFYISHVAAHILLIIFCITMVFEIIFFNTINKLFIIPKKHVLTSFLRLFYGLVFLLVWHFKS